MHGDDYDYHLQKRLRSTPEPESASKRRIMTNPADGTPLRLRQPLLCVDSLSHLHRLLQF